MWYNIKSQNIGMSPSGKALDFDSIIRQFKSGHPSQKKAPAQASAFFSYIRLRRVLLLRSDIRLTPSGICFASLGGEYNITAERSGAISLLRKQKYHADEVSISLKAFDSEVFRNFVDAFRAFRVSRQIRTSEIVEMFTKLWYTRIKG